MESYSIPSRQRGAALVVILTFLLITSLLAISGIETAMQESVMVAKMARIESALSNAEYGLQLGESHIRSMTQDDARLDIEARDAVYPLTGPGSIDPALTDWSLIPEKGRSETPAVEYVIQYGGPFETVGETTSVVMPSINPGKATAHLFIITARAEMAGTIRMVQSVYVSAKAP